MEAAPAPSDETVDLGLVDQAVDHCCGGTLRQIPETDDEATPSFARAL